MLSSLTGIAYPGTCYPMRPLGPDLRIIRKRAKLTQVQLAERTGYSKSTISAIETGEIQPPLETLEKLVNGCGGTLRVDMEANPHLTEIEEIFSNMDEKEQAKVLRVIRLAGMASGDALGGVIAFLEKVTPPVKLARIGDQPA